MSSTTQLPTTAAPSRLVTRPRTAVCRCGQDLDVVRGRHCSRCGARHHSPHL